MRKEVERDIKIFLKKKFKQTEAKYICIRTNVFRTQFVKEFPLKYQRKDKFIISSDFLVQVIKEMNVASDFKFNQKKPKRYKFLKRRVS